MSTQRILYTFMHGFACDASFWEELISSFSFPSIVWDRGYYANPYTEYQKAELHIGVGHSLGLIHLLESPYPFDIYIGIQSFIDFIGGNPQRKTELDIMKRQLTLNIQQTLRRFCKRGGLPLPHTIVNEEQLLIDYEKLYNRYDRLTQDKVLYLCATKDDIIVPLSLIENNFPTHQIQIAPDAKHALGYVQVDYLRQYLESIGNTLLTT